MDKEDRNWLFNHMDSFRQAEFGIPREEVEKIAGVMEALFTEEERVEIAENLLAFMVMVYPRNEQAMKLLAQIIGENIGKDQVKSAHWFEMKRQQPL